MSADGDLPPRARQPASAGAGPGTQHASSVDGWPMERASFVFTVFFMLLGPLKIIPAFVRLTRDADRRFKRDVAIKASAMATGVVAVVALLGGRMVATYDLSIDSLRLAGALVLLVAALRAMFPSLQPSTPPLNAGALQLAVSPIAIPIIVPPAGIAAILIFSQLSPTHYPLGLALATMMALDFLVMFYINEIEKIPGLLLVLQAFGAILLFIQAALAFDTMTTALRSLRVIP